MTLGSLLLYGLAILTVMAAGFAVAIARDERSRARWLLATSVGLAGVLALVGAVPLSLVLLFVAAGQALVTLYAVSVVQSLDRSSQESPGRRAAAASHWLSIVLGIGGGLYLASAIGRALGDGPGAETVARTFVAGFDEIARVVLIDHGFATIFVALLLLAVTVASGFLANQEND